MICHRCGKCCLYLDINIINPGSILPDGTLDPEDPDAMIFTPAGKICLHIAWEEKRAVCTIHHLPCYQGTPCQQFEQIGPEDTVCILSGYFRAIGNSLVAYKECLIHPCKSASPALDRWSRRPGG